MSQRLLYLTGSRMWARLVMAQDKNTAQCLPHNANSRYSSYTLFMYSFFVHIYLGGYAQAQNFNLSRLQH